NISWIYVYASGVRQTADICKAQATAIPGTESNRHDINANAPKHGAKLQHNVTRPGAACICCGSSGRHGSGTWQPPEAGLCLASTMSVLSCPSVQGSGTSTRALTSPGSDGRN